MSTMSVLESYVLLKRSLAAKWAAKAKELGLGPTQISVLYRLLQSDATMTELVDHAVSDKGAMTRTINSLVKMGLVKRKPDIKDGRITRIELTSKGKTLALEAKKIRMSFERKLDFIFSADERGQFEKLVLKLNNKLQET